ncbi:TIR domain-containing protein [Nocardia vinacea]|uniref:nSTAND1 domain-containing NTPase n=1 Tax=Nocardia vinacea TaxID=96468 RepID=UPI002E0EE388|nr:TIR domain-containing protein [Nocardia vinacea]
MTRLFLSHSSQNNLQAVALLRWLVDQQPGLAGDIFLDLDEKSGIGQGVRWRDALRRAMTRCEAVICLTSRDWHASTECVAEYLTAVTLGKRIFCARLEQTTDIDPTREWQRCDLFGDGPATEIQVDGQLEPVRLQTEGLRRLLDGLGSAGLGAEHFRWPPENEPDRSPYRGWRPFDAVDAAVYFGRDVQILAGLDHLRRMRSTGSESMFVVLGPSGTGKSSFLRAGLLPRLAREYRHFLVLDILRPERQALTGVRGLAAVIYTTRTRLGLTTPTLGDIKSALPDDIDRVREWLVQMQHAVRDRWLDNHIDTPAPTLLLPIDQAEELFVTDAGVQGQQFLTLLGQLLVEPEDAGAQQVSMKVVVTIRTDRYQYLQNAVQLKTVPRYLFDALEPLPRTQFKEVITGPASRSDNRAALTIEPELVDRLLADGDHGADTLPLLALTLSRLYDDYAGSGTLTLEQYTAMGGIDGVVHTEIESLLTTDPQRRQNQLEVLRSAFIPALATINPDSDQPMRRIARWNELPENAHELIDGFVDKRMLVKDCRNGEVVVEVALESLLRQWDSLARWLRDQADDLKAADRLEHAVQGWDRNGRDEAWLLEGTRLSEAETLSAKPEYQRRLEPAHEFLLASRCRQQDRLTALRRRAQALAALLVVAIVVAVLAGIGFWQANTASDRAEARTREAVAQRLITEAKAMLDPSRSGGDIQAFQQILAAHALAPSPQTASAIVGALYARRQTTTIIDTGTSAPMATFSPDGRRIVSGSGDGTLRLWDAASGQPVGEPLTGHTSEVGGVAFSPDGRRIVSGSDDGTLRLWDTGSGQPIGQPLTGHTGGVWSVAVSPDGRRIVSGGADKTLRLWDTQSGQPIGEPLTGHTSDVWSVAFSPDGKRIVSGGGDKTLRLWDTESGQPVGEPLTGHTDAVWSVTFSPDGKRIVSGSLDGTLRLWDTESGQPVGQPLTGHTGGVWSVAFSPDGRRIVSGGGDGTLRLWDTESGQPVGQPLTGHTRAVWSVAFSPDGKRIVSGSLDDTLRLWDAASGQPLTGHNGAVWSVAFSPDGKRIVSGGGDKTLRLWDTEAGQPIGQPLTGHTGGVWSVAFSPDGKQIVSGSLDGTLRLWDTGSGQPIGQPLTGHTGGVWSVAFSADGKRIVSGSLDGTLRLWDTGSGQPIGQPLTGHTSGVRSVAFSPDGRRIVSGSFDNTLRLWDAESGQPIGQPLTGHTGGVWSVAFSPDGKQIVSGSDDDTLRLWDTQSGQPIGEPLTSHTDALWSVAFSPDGKRIVSGSLDDTLRLWDAESRQPITDPLTGHTGDVWSVVFSPDGKRIASSSIDSTLRIWPVYDAAPEKLCAKLISNMSHQNWRDWIRIPNQSYIRLCPGLPIRPD